MKNIITVFLMLVALSVTAQKKNNPAIDCYLTTATLTFNLSEESKDKLNEALIEKFKERRIVSRKVKAEEISKDEEKTQKKASNQKYFKAFAIIAGKSKKEIMVFEKETRKKCNKK